MEKQWVSKLDPTMTATVTSQTKTKVVVQMTRRQINKKTGEFSVDSVERTVKPGQALKWLLAAYEPSTDS